jgi:hypothetical protein
LHLFAPTWLQSCRILRSQRHLPRRWRENPLQSPSFGPHCRARPPSKYSFLRNAPQLRDFVIVLVSLGAAQASFGNGRSRGSSVS